MKADNVKKDDSDDKGTDKGSDEKGNGDVSVEIDDTPYDTWLAAHGLVSLQENIHKKGNNSDSDENGGSKDDLPVKQVQPVKPVKPDIPVKDVTPLLASKDDDQLKKDEKGNFEKIKNQVEVMISQGEKVKLSEAKLRRLKTILGLLEPEPEDVVEIHKREEKKKKEEEEACIKEEEAIEEENKKDQEDLLHIAEEQEEKRLKEQKALEEENICRIKQVKEKMRMLK